jgi:LPXTG-motif cell wall-anchored protein
MSSYRRFRGRGTDPEARLRAHRAEPRDEFVRELSARVDADRAASRRPTAWSRLAFAGAASTLILGMFATVGGFTYVASGATATYSGVKQVVVQHKLTVSVHKSSASDEYPGTPSEPPQQNVAGTNTQSSAVGGVASADTLPFTGISLLATVLIGAMLLALGLILRRRERRNT